MIKLTAQHEKFIDAAAGLYPGQAEFSKSQIKKICAETGCPNPSWLQKAKYRCGPGTYSLELEGVQVPANVVAVSVPVTVAPPVTVSNFLTLS